MNGRGKKSEPDGRSNATRSSSAASERPIDAPSICLQLFRRIMCAIYQSIETMSGREIAPNGSQRTLSGAYLRCPTATLITVNQSRFSAEDTFSFFPLGSSAGAGAGCSNSDDDARQFHNLLLSFLFLSIFRKFIVSLRCHSFERRFFSRMFILYAKIICFSLFALLFLRSLRHRAC